MQKQVHSHQQNVSENLISGQGTQKTGLTENENRNRLKCFFRLSAHQQNQHFGVNDALLNRYMGKLKALFQL